MDESRRVQKVGYNSLSISIPKQYVKDMNLKQGDSLLFREDSDGTLRLIPATKAREAARATLRAEQAGSPEMLARLIVGAYALGYDAIEVTGREPLDHVTTNRVIDTVKRLRGMEVVESDVVHIVAQSFIDPTKFPVDSLIKRLQMLVTGSLERVTESLDSSKTANLEEVASVKEEMDELYWLILRQLLVALNRRELASEIGIESPLHASGDRISAKMLDGIGGMVGEIAQELLRLRGMGTVMGPTVTAGIRRLATKTEEAFTTTVESLLTSDIKLIGSSVALVEETARLEKEFTEEMLASGEFGYARVLASYFGQIARYCNIIIEISSHRLLRKTSRVATVKQ